MTSPFIADSIRLFDDLRTRLPKSEPAASCPWPQKRSHAGGFSHIELGPDAPAPLETSEAAARAWFREIGAAAEAHSAEGDATIAL